MKITVKALLYPTEDEEKVLSAVRNIVSLEKLSKVFEGDETYLVGVGDDSTVLRPLYYRVREKRILDAVRKTLKRNRHGNKTFLFLHKQAAYVGAVSLTDDWDESPLGSIYVEIESEEIDRVIDWLSPPTVEGKPLKLVDEI